MIIAVLVAVSIWFGLRARVDEAVLDPSQVMMAAAHNYELIGTKACGLKTAFVPRLTEFGEEQTSDLRPEGDYDIVAADFYDLAGQLGC